MALVVVVGLGITSPSQAMALGPDQALRTLNRLPGYKRLNGPQRDLLRRLVIQPKNVISNNARAKLHQLAGDAAFGALDPDLQAVRLIAITKDPSVIPFYAQVIAAIQRAERSYQLSESGVIDRVISEPKDPAAFGKKLLGLFAGKRVAIGPGDFCRKTEPAAAFVLRAGGVETTITIPLIKGSPPRPDQKLVCPGDTGSAGEPLLQHSVLEVADAVAALPVGISRAIEMHRRRSLLDGPFAEAYGRKDFRAYMAALVSPLGQTAIYPHTKSASPDAKAMPNSLTHEDGHALSYRRWSLDAQSKGWRAWKKAIEADGMVISGYAGSSFLEAAAEMFLTVSAIRSMGQKGQALAEELSNIVPNQWKMWAVEPGVIETWQRRFP